MCIRFIKLCGLFKKKRDKIDRIKDNTIKKVFYNLVFQENLTNNSIDNSFWNIVQKGSGWSKYMGGIPEVLENNIDGKFIRLNCVKDNDTYVTSGIKSKNSYGDGRFECEARFHSGNSTWPAIWMSHPRSGLTQEQVNNYEKYYEVDLSEYYETRDNTVTTYHCQESLKDSSKGISKSTNINTTGWNKFVCEWDNNSIVVYINDIVALKIDNNGDSSRYPLLKEDRTFNFILSMQYGNSYLSSPDDSQLPLYMDIRNIKYYKAK